MQYREIEQIGLEMLNCSGKIAEAEMCELACKSLSIIDNEYILCVSNMEYVLAILDGLENVSESDKTRMVSFIRSKNAHELYDVLAQAGCDIEFAEKLSRLIMFTGSNEEVLALAEDIAFNERMRAAIESLRPLSRYPNVRVDLTLMNDLAYYNGLVVCGYVRRIPKAVLTGGFYDKMAQKFGKKGGTGFALNLGELNARYEEKNEYDLDIRVIYSDECSSEQVLERATALRKNRTKQNKTKKLLSYI